MTPIDHASGALRVAVIEDHELLAVSLTLALRAQSIGVTVLQLDSAEQVIADTVRDRPDVVLVDLQLEDKAFDGASLITALADRGLRVLVVTGVTDRDRLAEAMELGATGFVSKSAPFDQFVDTIRRCARGERVMSAAVTQQLTMDLRRHRAEKHSRESVFRRLSHREQQVLQALCGGSTVEEIAGSWTVSVATVRSQVRAILAKLEVTSQLTAVALARKSHWPPPGEDVPSGL